MEEQAYNELETHCPLLLFNDSNATKDRGSPCVLDETCLCVDPYVREMVNVTIEGLGCYACEPQRPTACTEAADQCTPEACECSNPATYVKRAATTIEGTPCHYCEPLNGIGGGVGMSEVTIAAVVIGLVVLCHFLGRKPAVAVAGRGSLRLARRQGDRSRAIRVHQEPLRFHEEALYMVGDAFDAVLDGAWELLGAAYFLVRSVFVLMASSLAGITDLIGAVCEPVTLKARQIWVQGSGALSGGFGKGSSSRGRAVAATAKAARAAAAVTSERSCD